MPAMSVHHSSSPHRGGLSNTPIAAWHQLLCNPGKSTGGLLSSWPCALQIAGTLPDGGEDVADVTAQQLHEELFESALHSVTAPARELFERRGRRWQCQPDRCMK